MSIDERPNPDQLLSELNEETRAVGSLKIYFGYAAGVGKTYAMLDDARNEFQHGKDILVGYIEPHTRPETMSLLDGLPQLPPKIIQYKNMTLKEFDLDEAIKRKPDLILIDELAHTNAAGVRNKKRFQDVEELLAAGIDVYTTVNVQHLESLVDIVEGITKIKVHETVPDYIFDMAEKVRLIDIEPDELLRRLESGKIYRLDRAQLAMSHFFTQENLALLREIALRKAANRLSNENQSERRVTEKMASTKILACISPSPSSEKCLRWTARAAEAFHAQWEAVYVENADSASMPAAAQKSLRANMDLAERLGAHVVTLSGSSVAFAVSEYAKLSGITNIVIGKSRKRHSIRNLFKPDLEDALISFLPNVEVHIIPAAKENGNKSRIQNRRLPSLSLQFSLRDTLITSLLLSTATLLCYVLKRFDIADQNLIIVYLLSVLVISRMTHGYLYGMSASVLSVLAFNFFFTDPYFTFNAIQPAYPVTFLIMLIIALITSTMTVRIKSEALFAAQREQRTNVLYEINKKLLATRGTENIVKLVSEAITTLTGRAFIFYTEDPAFGKPGSLSPLPHDQGEFMLKDDEMAVAHWVFVNQKRAGCGTDTLAGAGALYMPVLSQGKVLAVWGISCQNDPLDHAKRQFLRMIASQVAMALERQRLSDEQRATQIESEREKMRATLLQAISHDLRTPLAGILGSSSTLRESGAIMSKDTRDMMLSDIQEEAQWLIRVVENLLSITRLNEGTTKVKKMPEAAEEVIAEAVSRIQRRFSDRQIEVSVPEQLIELPMDGTLIMQVLINLLENAIKNSPEKTLIRVNLSREGEMACFEVLDQGRGIAQDSLPWSSKLSVLPEPRPDTARGIGIGLSICDTIIKAHSGHLEASKRPEGGASLRFYLPIKEDTPNGNKGPDSDY